MSSADFFVDRPPWPKSVGRSSLLQPRSLPRALCVWCTGGAQAILCRLEGAEELAASEAGTALVQRRLPGEILVAAPGPRTDPSDPTVAVILFDTSTQRDLNLNKEIVHDFCIAGAFMVTQVNYSTIYRNFSLISPFESTIIFEYGPRERMTF